jgi:hypothetical protein
MPLLSLFLFLLLSSAGAARGMVQVGQTAPAFTLHDLQGVSHSLEAYRGSVVLLAFVGYG